MKKTVIFSTMVALVLIGGAFVLSENGTKQYDPTFVNNVSIVDSKQIVEITAKGGYSPRKSVAKAGIPTILKFDTQGTFDCSSSIRIPSINVATFLPRTGSTDIPIGSPNVGVMRGSCGMGMYPFEIDFQS